LRLGDLRPRPLHRVALHAGRRFDQRAQRLQFRHEFLMTQRVLQRRGGNGSRRARWRILLDPKDLALHRHDASPGGPA
jgi:hypothetical protein